VLRYTSRRLLWAIPTLFVITFLVFLALRAGTDPVASYLRVNPRATPEKIQQYKETNGLIGSPPEQYFHWLGHFLTGNWGNSIKGNRPVWPEMKNALANTLVLGAAAVVVGVSIGLGIGILAALRPYSKFDSAATTGAFIGFSIPPFVAAVLLQLFFAVYMTKWLGLSKPFLPTSGVYPPGHSGFDPVLRAKHLILPVTVVAIQTIAVYSRYMRTQLMEVKSSDYMRTARSKGISERAVIVKHGLRNALIPIVTVAAIDIGAIIGGLIITERIFEYKGMGDFFLTALGNGDFPQLMPWLVIVVISVILFNLLADVLYAVLDPRIRLE
jgi:ABC-type dipeptide/oligopeptide/nickel transport system permease component